MQKRLRDGMLVLLACAAGCVDALSYLKLGHVFTANMTGNTVLLGIAFGQLHGLAVLRSLLALLGFGVGVALATVVEQNSGGGHRIWPLPVTLVLALECVLLWLFAFGVRYAEATGYTATDVRALIALSAVTMGLQSVAGRRLDVSGVTTTYITGTFTGLVSRSVSHLLSRTGWNANSGSAPVRRSRARYHLGLLAGVWAGYLAAAVVMALMLTRFSFAAAVIPAALLTLIVATAAARYRQR
jgi:uncharacterized membrane protein YoaK (UPF0700 family)